MYQHASRLKNLGFEPDLRFLSSVDPIIALSMTQRFSIPVHQNENSAKPPVSFSSGARLFL